MNNNNFSLVTLKQLDMVDYLDKLGHQPTKIRGNEYWFFPRSDQRKKRPLK